jgi:hypothetical protein
MAWAGQDEIEKSMPEARAACCHARALASKPAVAFKEAICCKLVLCITDWRE